MGQGAEPSADPGENTTDIAVDARPNRAQTPHRSDPGPSTHGLARIAAAAAMAVLGVLYLLARISDTPVAEAPPLPPTPTAAPPVPTPFLGEPPPGADEPPADPRSPHDDLLFGRPVLAEPTNLVLFYGGADRLQRLDLDTGGLLVYPVRASPVAQSGEWLVLDQPATGQTRWLPLDEPVIEPTGSVAARPAVVDEPGFVWTLDDEGWLWTRLDLSDGRVVQERQVGRRVLRFAPAATFEPLAGPEMLMTSDGLYDYRHEVHRKLDSARLVAYDDRTAVVEHCQLPTLSCSLVWHDRISWDVTHDVPLDQPPTTVELAGSGRWIHLAGDGEIGHELIEVGSAARIPIEGRVEALAVSPDGRWLAVQRPTGLEVVDLDDRHGRVVVDAFERALEGDLLFVDIS